MGLTPAFSCILPQRVHVVTFEDGSSQLQGDLRGRISCLAPPKGDAVPSSVTDAAAAAVPKGKVAAFNVLQR